MNFCWWHFEISYSHSTKKNHLGDWEEPTLDLQNTSCDVAEAVAACLYMPVILAMLTQHRLGDLTCTA